MIQAGLYLRMSRDAEARGLGIGRQRKDGEASAGRLGWPIVQEYSDNDLSASRYSHKPRQGYARMLQDLQEGAINAVVVYDQDRLVRQPKGAGGAGPTAAPGATATDWTSAPSSLMRPPSSRSWPAAPLLVSPLAVSGTERGRCPNSRGGRWSPATLRRILIGPHLAGLRVYGEQLYPAAWPAILSDDTHHALRALLTGPQRKTNPMRPTRHLWSGFLVCGHCGLQMYAYYRQAKSAPVKTLRCHRKLGGCGRLARGAEPIETFLEAAILEMARRPAFTQFLNRRSAVPDERGDLLDQIRAVEALQRENLVAYAAPEPGPAAHQS